MSHAKENKQLKDMLRQFMTPLKNASYPIVMEVLTGHPVIAFNSKDALDKTLLKKLQKGLHIATKQANLKGIFRNRPNEVGNDIEAFVKEALNDLGLASSVPSNTEGKKQSTGYPDILVEDSKGRITYLECKTYSKGTEDSNLRSFYFQISQSYKINYPARHLLVAFEIETENRNGKDAFVPVAWKLFCLHSLNIQMKHEFNASNRDMYGNCQLLAKGKV